MWSSWTLTIDLDFVRASSGIMISTNCNRDTKSICLCNSSMSGCCSHSNIALVCELCCFQREDALPKHRSSDPPALLNHSCEDVGILKLVLASINKEGGTGPTNLRQIYIGHLWGHGRCRGCRQQKVGGGGLPWRFEGFPLGRFMMQVKWRRRTCAGNLKFCRGSPSWCTLCSVRSVHDYDAVYFCTFPCY